MMNKKERVFENVEIKGMNIKNGKRQTKQNNNNNNNFSEMQKRSGLPRTLKNMQAVTVTIATSKKRLNRDELSLLFLQGFHRS